MMMMMIIRAAERSQGSRSDGQSCRVVSGMWEYGMSARREVGGMSRRIYNSFICPDTRLLVLQGVVAGAPPRRRFIFGQGCRRVVLLGEGARARARARAGASARAQDSYCLGDYAGRAAVSEAP